MKFCALLLVILTAACATSYVPREQSHAALQRYVEQAAEVVRAGGASCDTFARAEWRNGDYYVHVTDAASGMTVCHPERPDLVGKAQTELQDANGKYFIREMLAAGASPAGRGWVEYVWPRPGQTTPAPKSTYVIAVDAPDGKRYLVGSGGYDLAP